MEMLYRVGQESDTSTNYITLYERYHFWPTLYIHVQGGVETLTSMLREY